MPQFVVTFKSIEIPLSLKVLSTASSNGWYYPAYLAWKSVQIFNLKGNLYLILSIYNYKIGISNIQLQTFSFKGPSDWCSHSSQSANLTEALTMFGPQFWVTTTGMNVFLLSSTWTDYAITSQSNSPQSQGAQCYHKPEAWSSGQGITTISCSSGQRESAGERTYGMDVHGKVMESCGGRMGARSLVIVEKPSKLWWGKEYVLSVDGKFMEFFMGHFVQGDYQSHEKHETPNQVHPTRRIGDQNLELLTLIPRKIDPAENKQNKSPQNTISIQCPLLTLNYIISVIIKYIKWVPS